MNFGDAKNLGMKVDVMKYFNWFGIKANYTYTHSKVTTDKRIMEGSEVKSVRQSRPLFGTGGPCGKSLPAFQRDQARLGGPGVCQLYGKTSERHFELV